MQNVLALQMLANPHAHLYEIQITVIYSRDIGVVGKDGYDVIAGRTGNVLGTE